MHPISKNRCCKHLYRTVNGENVINRDRWNAGKPCVDHLYGIFPVMKKYKNNQYDEICCLLG